MDGEDIINGLLRGAFGGRRKRSRRARRAMGRRGSLLNATTLLAAAGVAWGVYETWQGQRAGGGSAPPPPGTPPPPLPGGSAAPPPLPTAGASGLPEPVLRVVRLMISAARADGNLAPEEREAILTEARRVGAEDAVSRELESPRPLAEIVGGVTDPKLAEELYTLAFGIVRADETVTGGERIYLAQLAHRLELGPETVSRLESEAASRIDAETDGPADDE